MKQKLKAIFKGPVVFYPLLFAAFPILFLYAYNIMETSISEVWLPLGVSVAAALVLWVILSLILRSLSKGGLATAIFLVFFFSYGRLYEALENWGVFVPSHGYLLPSVLFAWGYCVYFISRSKRDFRITTKMLNIMGVALIVINLFNIGAYQVKLARLSDVTSSNPTEQSAVNSTEPSTLPDIYFIILDEYAHPDTMKEWYDYDNSEFVNSLEDKGFFIASDSETRSPKTPQCLAQILNMEYLDDETPMDQLYRMIGYSDVAGFLRAQGYRYIVFGNWGDVGRRDNYAEDNADLYFNYYIEAGTQWVSKFQETLWNTTMLSPFYRYILRGEYESAYRCMTLHTLEHLKALPELQGPKFVVAHMMCPHEAFVFGPSGEVVHTSNWYNYRDKQYYLGQYIFINAEISKAVDVILEESLVEPIIVIQSDHGLRPHHVGIEIGPDEWRKILNAMYLPGMDYAELSDSISPVNTFRLIFNHYFDADYPLLEDD